MKRCLQRVKQISNVSRVYTQPNCDQLQNMHFLLLQLDIEPESLQIQCSALAAELRSPQLGCVFVCLCSNVGRPQHQVEKTGGLIPSRRPQSYVFGNRIQMGLKNTMILLTLRFFFLYIYLPKYYIFGIVREFQILGNRLSSNFKIYRLTQMKPQLTAFCASMVVRCKIELEEGTYSSFSQSSIAFVVKMATSKMIT